MWLCFRWCPWNWSLVEYPQKGHPFLWEIYGSAKMLLLWLQVMSHFFFQISCIVGYYAQVGCLTSNFVNSLKKGWTARSCLHAPVTWTESALPAVSEPRVRVSHRTWETQCTRYSDQRLHQTSGVLRAGAEYYSFTRHKFRVSYCSINSPIYLTLLI